MKPEHPASAAGKACTERAVQKAWKNTGREMRRQHGVWSCTAAAQGACLLCAARAVRSGGLPHRAGLPL